MNVKVRIGGMVLRNPVMTASGTFGYGEEFSEFFDLARLGAVVVKGISLKPMDGNPPPRITETPCGMLNSIGLQNVGLRRFLKEKLPILEKFDTNVIVNILGGTSAEYVRLASALDEAAGVQGIELNVSCPNVKKGGVFFGSDVKSLERLVKKVRAVVRSSVLIVKLSPSVHRTAEFARAAEGAGADAVSLINTIPALAVDAQTQRPVLGNVTGGLSGPAIKPVALKMVWDAARAVDIPVIGMGGIMNAADAVEFILAGAAAVAVGTANFVNPMATVDIADGIQTYLKQKGITDISGLRGALLIDDNPDD